MPGLKTKETLLYPSWREDVFDAAFAKLLWPLVIAALCGSVQTAKIWRYIERRGQRQSRQSHVAIRRVDADEVEIHHCIRLRHSQAQTEFSRTVQIPKPVIHRRAEANTTA